jgi:hypothetical protein
MRLLHLVLLLLLAALADPAFAAVTLRYAPDSEGGLGRVIEADDAGNIRAESSNGQMLMILGSEIYLVMPARYDGAVIRLEDALALAAELRVAVGPPPAPARHRIVERGPQRIGQWEGTLYWIDPLPPVGQELRSEIVIANDPALRAAGRAFIQVEEAETRLFNAAFGNPPTDYVTLVRGLFDRGLMLRIAGRYRLEGVSGSAIPPERFRLPGPVLSRDAYRALLTR